MYAVSSIPWHEFHNSGSCVQLQYIINILYYIILLWRSSAELCEGHPVPAPAQSTKIHSTGSRGLCVTSFNWAIHVACSPLCLWGIWSPIPKNVACYVMSGVTMAGEIYIASMIKWYLIVAFEFDRGQRSIIL